MRLKEVEMKINIPCPECGCQHCEATTKLGENVKLEICKCNDGSGEFEVTVYQNNAGTPSYEKHQCSEGELAGCLTARYNIILDSITHNCN
jgi:hypothetical protein